MLPRCQSYVRTVSQYDKRPPKSFSVQFRRLVATHLLARSDAGGQALPYQYLDRPLATAPAPHSPAALAQHSSTRPRPLLDSDMLGVLPVSAAGTFRARFPIPKNAPSAAEVIWVLTTAAEILETSEEIFETLTGKMIALKAVFWLQP